MEVECSSSDSCSDSGTSSSSLGSSMPPVEAALNTSTLAASSSNSASKHPLRSSLAAMKARTKSRTQFALQVIAASKAALEATDALIAASDALLAAPRGTGCSSCSQKTPEREKLSGGPSTTTSPPEACEASDSSESETQSLQEEEAEPNSFQAKPPHKVSPAKDLRRQAQDDSTSSEYAKGHSSSETASSLDDEQEEVSSTMDGDPSISKSSNVTSVDLLLKGKSHADHFANRDQHVISGSLLSGSFDKKAPIPQYSTSEDAPRTGLDELTASPAPAPPRERYSSESSKEESGSGSSEEVSSDSEEESAPSGTGESQSTDVERDEYVDELLGELGGVHRSQMASSEPPLLLSVTPLTAMQPAQSTAITPPQNQKAVAPTPSPPKPQVIITPQQAIEQPHLLANKKKDEADESESSSMEDSSDVEEFSSTEGDSMACDVEEDDYVEDLLSELKQTKVATQTLSVPGTPSPMKPQNRKTSDAHSVKTVSVTTATTAAATTTSTATPAEPPKAAIKNLVPIPQQIKHKGSDDGSDDDSDKDSSEEATSGVESSDDSGDAGDDEDDEYVAELLNELNATKPAALLPQQKFPKGGQQSPIPQVSVASDSDDDDSDVEETSSSDYDSSDDSDLFSTDGEDSSESSGEERLNRRGSTGTLGTYESGDEYTSGDDEYVDDLLQELQAPRAAAKASKTPPMPPAAKGPGGFPQPPPGMGMGLGMPGMPGLPGMAGEGLNLDAIRSELEKVGRAVMTQKSGEAFVARAQILASINQLSSHVPNCVLDFLGKEIRALMAAKKKKEEMEEEQEEEPGKKHTMIDVISNADDMSDVSALSDVDIDITDHEEGGSTVGFFVDTSAVKFDGGDMVDVNDSKNRDEAVPRGLMRKKSEEALDRMFKEAREDVSLNKSITDLSQGIENMFSKGNEYGLTKQRSVASFGGSMESSIASSVSDGPFNKFKSRSRAGSMASMSWGADTKGKLPSVSRFECALLFVDISGFTKLSTLLDPETLSKVINSYFQLIVSKIYEYNGDIQKFAGDAIFAEWRCSEKDPMEFCVAAATACASQIVDECSDFPVMAGGAQSRTGEPISSLNVHCALGSGQMIGIHVGDNTRRREYLFLGEPIDQLTWGADLAKHGELVVSPEAFRSLSLAAVLDFNIRPSESEPAIIAKRSITMFRSEKLKDYRVSRAEYAKSRGVTGHVEGLEVEDLKVYQELMALYVHPVVAAMHMDEKSKMKSKSSAQERHREEAELRRVYIMFIHPLITISEENDFAVDLLNEIMNLTSTQLERYCGHLRQMIVDDKGLVLIGTFGLRGSTFPNMVAERALPATIALHNALQSQLGVNNRIGATFGEVYCGAVGGVKRHEYAVLGPSANLAARLMGNKNNPGILVEANIRRMASRKYAFNALPPVKAKGYAEPVPIFEPLSPLERSWGRIQPNFVGRETEIKALMGMARDIVSAPTPKSRLVFVASQSGMGKSTMVAHAIEHIRNLIGDNTRRLVITKQVGKESHSLLPFGMFRSILLDVLANFAASTDDKSHVSGVSGFTSQSLSLQSLSARSQGSSTALSLAKSEELLKVLCRELNAPSGFVDHVLHNLSGKGSGKSPGSKAPSMKSMVSFMDRAFRRCTEETKLVVVALDDVQHIDEMTWKVLRQVFEGCDNVLMICAFDLSRSRDLRVEADFWQVLNQKYRPSGHFIPMELGGLGKEEITLMTMKTLGLQKEDISPDLLNEVLIQSGGMPHFANEFLELVKRRQFTEMMDGRSHGMYPKPEEGKEKKAGPMGSVPEIILHRIDSFDVAVRNVLNIAAVLGKSFSLKEVTAVLKENHDMQEHILIKEATASLETAINEGILRKEENQDNDDDSKTGDGTGDGTTAADKPENTVYSFYHSIWQTTILSLMLDARKMDVHKKIALSMEKEKEKDGSDFAFQMKLLGHWKSSGNTTKLTNLALEVGKHFEQQLSMPTQSIRVYEEALDAWKDDKPSGHIGGISPEALEATEPEELQHISALHVALGRAFSGASRNADSALCFHDALRVLRVPKGASKVTDRSAAFPAYHGLYECAKAKQIIEEDGKRYEQLLIKKYLEDTKHHEEKYHHVHAITCQMDIYRRNDDMVKAVGIQKVLYNVYDHIDHNKKLKETYGCDEAALSFANSAMWHWQLGDKEAALDACRHVIGKLMPKMDRTDVHQSFVMMYPVALVMKDTGVAVQARKHFDRLVVKPFSQFFGEGKSSFFLPVYEPILMLLHLAGTPDLDEDTLEEYAEWALDRDRLSFGTLANRRLGVLGRCADSLSAEICFLLAEHIEEEETRRVLTEHGKEIAQEALVFNTEQGLKGAEHQVKILLTRYESLIAEVDEDFDDASDLSDYDEEPGNGTRQPPLIKMSSQLLPGPPRPPPKPPLHPAPAPTLPPKLGPMPKAEAMKQPEESSSEDDSDEDDSSELDSDDISSDDSDSSEES